MKYKQLTREQRYAIYLGLKAGMTLTAIARQIGVSVSTVSREVRRNTNKYGHYIFEQACELAQVRKERSCANRRIPAHVVKQALSLLLEKDWSPQQISGFLRPMGILISHETIYSLIRQDTTGELRSHTRHGMKYRRHIKVRKATKATNIPNRTSIHMRPPEADGTRFGDWELDLVVGKGQCNALVTLTERSTNFLLMGFVLDKRPATVAHQV